MSEIEQAIENLEYFIGGDCCDNQMDFLEEIGMGIAALREKAEREKGCEYCNREDIAKTVCYIPLDNGDSVDIPYHSCSNCGKRLEVEP